MSTYRRQGNTRLPPHDGAAGFVVLLVVLIVGHLLYVSVSPGTFLVDVQEVILPVGITGGLFVVTYLLWVHGDRRSFDPQVSRFGWLGALVGGTAGAWLVVHELPVGLPFDLVYGDALTVLTIAIAVGTLVGITTTRARLSEPQREPAQESVLAESTWTNRSGANPILVELVEQLSDLTDADPFEMAPLSTYIEPEVFQRLRAGGDSPWQLRFFTAEYEVLVESRGTITVSDVRRPAAESGATTIHSSPLRRGISPAWNGAHESSDPARTPPADPVQMVRESVAEHEQVDAADLPPLDEWLHPATLDALTGSWGQLDSGLEFRYLWYHVTVHPDGSVHVRAR